MELATALGPMHSASWRDDPKHLAFVLARYHFVARLLTGREYVLEIGCGEGTGTKLVKQAVGQVYGIDIDRKILPSGYGWFQHNILDAPFRRDHTGYNPSGDLGWDAIYAVDVLEHIPREREDAFFSNVLDSLNLGGCVVLGSPSAESQRYASTESRKYHVNCKSEDEMRRSCENYFDNVFLLGMNDTTIHCGYGPMTHYRWVICC